MESAQPSYDLLAHFDPPGDDAAAVRRVSTRDVRWVLKWAAACGVFYVAAAVFIQFGYRVAAEQVLNRAARAGALEATLPRASLASVTDVIERRLDAYAANDGSLRITLLQNGLRVRGGIRPADDDRFTVLLNLPASAAEPGWLRTLVPWHSDLDIEAQAQTQMPGRHLRLTARD